MPASPRDHGIVGALEHTVESFGLPFDRAAALASLGDPGVDEDDVRIVRAAERLGLHAQPLLASPTELAGRASPETRYLAFPREPASEAAGAVLCVTVEPGRLVELRVDPDGGIERRHLDAPGLARELGVGRDTAVRFVALDPLPSVGVVPDAHGTPSVPEAMRLFLEPDRRDVASVLVYAVAAGLFSLVTPLTAQALVSTVAFGTLLQPIFVLGAILLSFLVVTAALRVLQAWVVEVLQRRLFVRAAATLSDRLVRLDRREPSDSTLAQQAATRFLEVANAQKALAALLLDGLEAALTTVVGLTVLAFYHPLLLAFDAVLLLTLAGIVFWLGRRGVETSVAESDAKYRLVDWFHALGARGVSLDQRGGPEFADGHVQQELRSWLEKRAAHFEVVQRQRIGALSLQAAASVGLLVVGGALVIDAKLTLGQLVAAELIVAAVAASAAKLAKHAESYYDLVTALKKLSKTAALPVREAHGEARGHRDGPARLTLRAGSDGGNGRVLLELAERDHTLLVGDDASPEAGAVRSVSTSHARGGGAAFVDGEDLAFLDHAVAATRVAYVRKPEVFPGTVLENVRFGRPELSLREVREALDALGTDEALARAGLHVRADVHGDGSLDAALAARIAIARARLGRPGLLVLDGTLDGLAVAEAERLLTNLLGDANDCTLVVRSRMSLEVEGLRRRTLATSEIGEAA